MAAVATASEAAAASTVSNTAPASAASSVNPGSPGRIKFDDPSRVTTYNTRRQNPEPAFVLHPRGNWRSFGSEKDMAAEAPPKLERERPATMHFQMRREFFLRRRLPNFLNRDAADDGAIFLRPMTRDATTDAQWVQRLESEASVQAVRPKSDHTTQTVSLRQIDFSVQVQPEIVDACSTSNEAAIAAGATTPEEVERNRKRLGGFFDKVMPRMLHHLRQSAEVPLFQDDFTLLMDEDSSAAVVNNREESDLIDAGNFQHTYTRDRHISAIDWKPGPRMIIAVASVRATSMEQRFAAALEVEPSTSIVWNLHEQTNPQLLLESPTEALCIKFHPKPLNTFVVAGLSNGQVVMWDMARAPMDHRRVGGMANTSAGGGSASHSGGGGAGGSGGAGNKDGGASSAAALQSAAAAAAAPMDDEVQVNIPPLPQPIHGHSTEIASDEHIVSRLLPLMISRVENSHRRAVHDIAWLPDGLECQFDGRASPQETTYQFATVSEDGSVFIWDLRPEHLPADRLRKLKHQGRSTGDEGSKVWVPLLRYQLPRSEGPGDLVGLRLHIEGRFAMGTGTPSYLMLVSTMEGELCCANWGPKPGSEEQTRSTTGYDASGPSLSSGGPGSQPSQKVVRYISAAHAGPVWAIHRHPLLQDIFLTVGDWGFKVWRVGVEVPILSSPMGEQQTTCGRWSPTRAGLVFIGTKDGFVHVWDLLDRSHQPILVHPVIKDAVTCIEFRPLQNAKQSHRQTQTIALGTKVGTIYFFELPRALVRGPSSELKNARSLFDRETRRVSYYSWRWEERRKELETRAATVSVDGADGDAAEKDKKAEAAAKSKQQQHQQQHQHDDMLGGKDDEGAGDFVFTADDDAQYLALVEQLAKADVRMQRHYNSSSSANAAASDDDE